MRLLDLTLLFGAAALVAGQSYDFDDDDDEEAPREPTVFNGKQVPPMIELTPDNWEKEHKATKYLMVKHYSPYCPHCIEFAPTFQTLYEFYYTSSPAGDSTAASTDFTSFYDFRFGDINCVAYSDLCAQHKVSSWPNTILYENGEPIATVKGGKPMEVLSEAVETALEKAKPGSRPAKILLPEPGAESSPDFAGTTVEQPASNTETPTERKDEKAGADEAAVAAPTPQVADATEAAQADESTTLKYAPVAFDPPAQRIITPKSIPNPNGESVPLTAETFHSEVTMSYDPWFIKFYAPWCHHCLKVKPNWDQLAKEVKGRLNIGEVNCDAEPKLCKDAGVKGYPTFLFYRAGERVEYPGLRGVGDFIQYAEKAIDLATGVPDVDAEGFEALEQKEEVIFLYFYDHATTTEDFDALERLSLSLIGRGKLVRTRDVRLYDRFKITTWPRLMVSREGRATYYPPSSPREMRETGQLLGWMRRVWLPLLPELTASNAREVMDGRIVVLGILDRQNEESFQEAIREMKSAANEWMDKQIQLFQLERQELRDAKQLRIEEAEDRGDSRALRNAKNMRINMDRADRKEVTFAWVDGTFWKRWTRDTYGIDIKDGERVIINDEDNRRYWDLTSTGNPIVPSRTSILETINKVTANPPKLKPKLTIGFFEKIIFDIKTTLREHPFLSAGCILGIAFGTLSWFRTRARKAKGGHFKLDDSVSKAAPLLGASSSGSKTD